MSKLDMQPSRDTDHPPEPSSETDGVPARNTLLLQFAKGPSRDSMSIVVLKVDVTNNRIGIEFDP